MKWAGVGFTVELACGKQVYVGTLEEMREREAAGILPGPDPCAEVEEARTNGHVIVEHLEPLPVGYEEFACVGFWQFC